MATRARLGRGRRFGEERGPKLLEPRGRVVEHREDRDPVGMLQRHFGLHRHQRVNDPVSLVVQIRIPQSKDERDKESSVTSIPARPIISQRVRFALAVPGSVRLPRRLVERRLPTTRFSSVFLAGQVAVETRNCRVPGFP